MILFGATLTTKSHELKLSFAGVIYAMRQIIPALLAAAVLSGCATPKIDWTARIGIYAYDRALADYGPPDKSAKFSDGSTVATWMTERSQTFINAGPYFIAPRRYYGPVFVPGYSQTYFPARYLELTFGADGKLKAEKEYSR